MERDHLLWLTLEKRLSPLPEGLVTSVGFSALGKVYYAFEGNIHCTGATIKWMVEKLGLVDSFNQIETLATSVKNNDGVYLVPAFTGLGAPWWKPDAKAAIWGMTLNAGKAHVLACRIGIHCLSSEGFDRHDDPAGRNRAESVAC